MLQEQLAALGDPFEAIWRIAARAEQEGDLATAGRMYAELAQYKNPKLKAIEHRPTDKPFERMTDDELDAIIRGGKPN